MASEINSLRALHTLPTLKVEKKNLDIYEWELCECEDQKATDWELLSVFGVVTFHYSFYLVLSLKTTLLILASQFFYIRTLPPFDLPLSLFLSLSLFDLFVIILSLTPYPFVLSTVLSLCVIITHRSIHPWLLFLWIHQVLIPYYKVKTNSSIFLLLIRTLLPSLTYLETLEKTMIIIIIR